jgi:hypothetical protein
LEKPCFEKEITIVKRTAAFYQYILKPVPLFIRILFVFIVSGFCLEKGCPTTKDVYFHNFTDSESRKKFEFFKTVR